MWFFLAVGASITWGLSYVFAERVYKYISVSTALALSYIASVLIFAFIAVANGRWTKDLHTLATNKPALLYLLLGMVTLVTAEFFIGHAITQKNATIAALIEISYPFFIALFSYLLFRESHVNLGTALGGFLIFLGVTCVYFFNR